MSYENSTQLHTPSSPPAGGGSTPLTPEDGQARGDFWEFPSNKRGLRFIGGGVLFSSSFASRYIGMYVSYYQFFSTGLILIFFNNCFTFFFWFSFSTRCMASSILSACFSFSSDALCCCSCCFSSSFFCCCVCFF